MYGRRQGPAYRYTESTSSTGRQDYRYFVNVYIDNVNVCLGNFANPEAGVVAYARHYCLQLRTNTHYCYLELT